MRQPFVARVIDPATAAERALVLDTLGALVDQRALVAREGLLVGVALDKVLTDLGADPLEEKAHVSENWVVPEDRVALLKYVIRPERRESAENH